MSVNSKTEPKHHYGVDETLINAFDILTNVKNPGR